MKQIRQILLLALITLMVQSVSIAQCAMCKANAESATQDDAAVGQELNNGILYLMGVPYLLLAVGVLVFYRKKILTFMRS
jgi:LPXTG-motif cell wall-anchored protein